MERDPVVRTAHPRWLALLLARAVEAICAANNAHPPMILRVNRRHHSRDAYLALLAEAGIGASACQYSRDGIVLAEACDVRGLPGFAEGWVSVRTKPRSCPPTCELAPGQRVLARRCCAPAASLLEAEACLAWWPSIEAKRLTRVQNLDRLQAGRRADRLRCPRHRQLVGRQTVPAHPARRAVLGHRRDPPHPDIKLTRQADDIPALATLQGELLDALWPTPK
jgi:16S rRNA (cytosine967-C5)-methyltransferase